MPFLFHAVIFLAYASMAAAVTFYLPQNLPGLDPDLSLVIGGMVLVACAVAHEAWARIDEKKSLLGEVSALREAQAALLDELARARGETRGIYEALEGARQQGGRRPDINEVIAEVSVLKKLVEQLSQRRLPGGNAGPRPAENGPPVAALRVASELDGEQILQHVRQGLNTGRVDLFLQPIVSLPQRKPRHYECFSRIRVDDESMIVPEQYIGLAERNGLIAAIDNMLLFRCVQLVRKCQARRRNTRFFCNISPHSLADAPFLKEFVDFMALNANLAPNLVFELSQSAFNRIDEEVIASLDRLAALGFRFSLDQVTRFDMNFAELGRHRVKFIKIEAGALLNQLRNARPGFSLRELKAQLNRYAIDLVAEKIEDEPTLVELLDYPIAFGQGFLFGEPRLSRDEV